MKRKSIIQIHVIYWVIMHPLLFFAYTYEYYRPLDGIEFFVFWGIGVVVNAACVMADFYIYYAFLVPRFILKKQQLGKFILATLVVYSIFICLFSIIWQREQILWGVGYNLIDDIAEKFPNYFGTVSYAPITATAFRLIEGWISSELSYLKQKKLSNESKIDFLRSQINPHFLFNTLNNIYSLSLTNKVHTTKALNRLQDTFTYLKRVELEKVISVKEALDYIHSYVDLSKLRLIYPDKVSLSITNTYSKEQIYPMLLIPFIENAFKHSNLVKEEDRITICIETNKMGISMRVENSIPEQHTQKDKQGGVGLKNVEERLELLFGRSQFKLVNRVVDHKYISEVRFPYAAI